MNKFISHPFAVLYQVDLPFPGYDRDAPSFHWKYDAMIESLISNNPPTSRRSKIESASPKEGVSPSSAAPIIGHRKLSRAQRKDIKKVHVPKGVVMQYEGELVDFLDQLTLSDVDDERSEGESCQDEVSAEDSQWVIIQSTDTLASQAEKPIQLNDAAKVQEDERTADNAQELQAGEQPQIVLRWDIQDQFLRFVAHALCSFYGLVSFSKTAKDGKRLVYICHPTHLESIGQLTTGSATVALSNPELTTAAPIRPKPPKRQSTLEHVQELPLQELDQLWNRVEPIKVMSSPRPEMTFFEYLYPSMRPMF
ncbi:hypothetical protein BGX27_010552 [Mortierella sp. AM989]|nr:hypothetical protein BGX27_010552 [Mortierella sp. AM989]